MSSKENLPLPTLAPMQDDDEESAADDAKADGNSTLEQDHGDNKKVNSRILKVCVFKMWAETCKCSKSCNWQILLGDTLKEAILFYNRHCEQWNYAPVQLTDASIQAIHKTADRSWRNCLTALGKDIVFPQNGEEPSWKPPSNDMVRDLGMKQNMNKIRLQWEQYFTGMILHVKAQSKTQGFHNETSVMMPTPLNKRKHDDSGATEASGNPEIVVISDQTANVSSLPKRQRVEPVVNLGEVDDLGENELRLTRELAKRRAALKDSDNDDDNDDEDYQQEMFVSLMKFGEKWLDRMHKQALAFQENIRDHIEIAELLGQLTRNMQASKRRRRSRPQPVSDRNAKSRNSKDKNDDDDDDEEA